MPQVSHCKPWLQERRKVSTYTASEREMEVGECGQGCYCVTAEPRIMPDHAEPAVLALGCPSGDLKNRELTIRWEEHPKTTAKAKC